MKRKQKPIDPDIRVAKTWTGNPPPPHRGPLWRRQQEQEQLRRDAEWLAEMMALRKAREPGD